jgi:hypothetical protein
MTVPATTLVRRALRAVGVHAPYIFTNKYKTCRTVKMYASTSAAFNAQCIHAVEALNIPGLSVDSHVFPCSYRGTRTSLIFRLPL